MPPAVENGYGPNEALSQPMISGWSANDAWMPAPMFWNGGTTVPSVQVFGLGGLPGGTGAITQPSKTLPSSSNPVEPGPVDTTMSSIATPGNWTAPSLA